MHGKLVASQLAYGGMPSATSITSSPSTVFGGAWLEAVRGAHCSRGCLAAIAVAI